MSINNLGVRELAIFCNVELLEYEPFIAQQETIFQFKITMEDTMQSTTKSAMQNQEEEEHIDLNAGDEEEEEEEKVPEPPVKKIKVEPLPKPEAENNMQHMQHITPQADVAHIEQLDPVQILDIKPPQIHKIPQSMQPAHSSQPVHSSPHHPLPAVRSPQLSQLLQLLHQQQQQPSEQKHQQLPLEYLQQQQRRSLDRLQQPHFENWQRQQRLNYLHQPHFENLQQQQSSQLVSSQPQAQVIHHSQAQSQIIHRPQPQAQIIHQPQASQLAVQQTVRKRNRLHTGKRTMFSLDPSIHANWEEKNFVKRIYTPSNPVQICGMCFHEPSFRLFVAQEGDIAELDVLHLESPVDCLFQVLPRSISHICANRTHLVVVGGKYAKVFKLPDVVNQAKLLTGSASISVAIAPEDIQLKITAACLSQHELFIGTDNGTLIRYELRVPVNVEEKLEKTSRVKVCMNKQPIVALALSASGEEICISADNEVTIRSLKSIHDTIVTLSGTTNCTVPHTANCIWYDEQMRALAGAYTGKSVKLWDLRNIKNKHSLESDPSCMQQIQGYMGDVVHVQFDEMRLVSADSKGILRVHRMQPNTSRVVRGIPFLEWDLEIGCKGLYFTHRFIIVADVTKVHVFDFKT